MSRHRPLLSNAALGVASVGLTLIAGELALRLSGYRYSALSLLPPGAGTDYRRYHAEAIDERVSRTEPVTVFDPVVLWRLNPRASLRIDERGLRGRSVATTPQSGELRLLCLGDSNTLGPLHEPDHWPGYLEERVIANARGRPVRVLNAGVYGYSSLQGLRRFRQLVDLRPSLAYWCFGANDGHRVAVPDDVWAGRLARFAPVSGSRLYLWVASRLSGAQREAERQAEAGAPLVPRVSVDAFRTHVQTFVALARSAGVRPVLLTRPYRGHSNDAASWLAHVEEYNEAVREIAGRLAVDSVDVARDFAESADAFLDDSHLNRTGHQRLAQRLVTHLRSLGVLETDRGYDSQVDLGTAPPNRPELGSGWWDAESWPGRPGGRWSQAEAEIRLEREGGERFALVELTLFHPSGRSCVRLDAGGGVDRVCAPNGRVVRALPLGRAAATVVSVRVAAEAPFIPAEAVGSDSTDRRVLGVFVHRAALSTGSTGPVGAPER